ncbi:MAG: cbb3-type cytochrome oxidase assembly protein CcoS [Gammaproteobacteria bacterium]|nr:cbb3-type cytochrome oxidase assembly protein CcoS [Gammaproteobacteria bacterium]
MEVIYFLIPLMIVIGLVMVGVLFWAARSGQYEDMEGPANRILMDDDDPLLPDHHDRSRPREGGHRK